MSINRSGYYKWKYRKENPSKKIGDILHILKLCDAKKIIEDIESLFNQEFECEKEVKVLEKHKEKI